MIHIDNSDSSYGEDMLRHNSYCDQLAVDDIMDFAEYIHERNRHAPDRGLRQWFDKAKQTMKHLELIKIDVCETCLFYFIEDYESASERLEKINGSK